MSGGAHDISIYYRPFRKQPGASRALLLEAAALYSGQAEFNSPVQLGPYGKPAFSGPGQPHFSLSHSAGYWVCAFGREPVGLDIQAHRAASPEKLAKRFFHPREAAYLAHRGYRDFFHMWAAKESYVKLTGQGITQGLDSFSVVSPEGLFPAMEGCQLRLLPFREGYSLCLAAAEVGRVIISAF